MQTYIGTRSIAARRAPAYFCFSAHTSTRYHTLTITKQSVSRAMLHIIRQQRRRLLMSFLYALYAAALRCRYSSCSSLITSHAFLHDASCGIIVDFSLATSFAIFFAAPSIIQTVRASMMDAHTNAACFALKRFDVSSHHALYWVYAVKTADACRCRRSSAA